MTFEKTVLKEQHDLTRDLYRCVFDIIAFFSKDPLCKLTRSISVTAFPWSGSQGSLLYAGWDTSPHHVHTLVHLHRGARYLSWCIFCRTVTKPGSMELWGSNTTSPFFCMECQAGKFCTNGCFVRLWVTCRSGRKQPFCTALIKHPPNIDNHAQHIGILNARFFIYVLISWHCLESRRWYNDRHS